MPQPKLSVERRSIEELSERQIAELMAFGVEEATIIDEIENATRTGNRERAWELCQRLCDVEDEAQRMTA
jgi:hypothetical protein